MTSTAWRQSFVEPAGGGLHAHLFEFAAQALQLVFLRRQSRAKAIREAAVGQSAAICEANCATAKSRRNVSSEPRPLMASTRRTPEETDAFAGQLEQADFAGGRGVRAAAELGREAVGQLHHAHLVAVLLAEQRHGVVLVHGHVDGHVLERFDLGVGQDFAVDDVFDFLRVLRRRPARSGRSRSAGGRDATARAGLLDVRAQHLAQRGMQQVRAGVVAADGVAAFAVDHGVDVIADGEVLLEDGLVRAHALHRQDAAGDLGNGGVAVRRQETAGVADLAAGVAVEAGVIEHDFDLIAGFGGGNAHAVLDDGEHFAVGGGRAAVAFEDGLGQIAEGGAGGSSGCRPSRRRGRGPALRRGRLEAFVRSKFDAGIARGIDHEVERKAKGLVEVKGLGRR